MSGWTVADDTIFALSSGALPAGVAVVRLSGSAAADTLIGLAGRLPKPRRISLAELHGRSGDLLDRALILWLPGPHTVTGEDMAELHLHGGRAVVAGVLAALAARSGLRQAEAGEFTRRAFANGRVDLAEAEGLADLLDAETDAQRRQALRLVEGGLGKLIARWQNGLLALAAGVEAAIEFGEDEEDVPPLTAGQSDALAGLMGEIEEALAQPPAERLRDGLRIVLAGPVNAGKSSLINALSGREVAITAPVEGTTRDLIEAPVVLDGIPCILIDAAGLRTTEDPIERIGVDRARGAMDRADLILWLGEPAECPATNRAIRIHARADLPGRALIPSGADIAVSVVTGKGMTELRSLIAEHASRLLPAEDTVPLNLRHRHLLGNALDELRAGAGVGDPVLLAEHLRAARSAFDRITGRAGVEDMLDALFGRFCIGK